MKPLNKVITGATIGCFIGLGIESINHVRNYLEKQSEEGQLVYQNQQHNYYRPFQSSLIGAGFGALFVLNYLSIMSLTQSDPGRIKKRLILDSNQADRDNRRIRDLERDLETTKNKDRLNS